MTPLEWAITRVQVTENIHNAPITMEPYPHIDLEKVFPESFFEKILENFPSKMAKSTEFTHQVDITADPGVARTADGRWEIENILKNQNEFRFWRDFRDYFFCKEFSKPILKKFEAFMKIKGDHYVCGRVAQDEIGAGLGPHKDRDDKIISMVFYLSENGSGTHLLRADNDKITPDQRHYSYDGFEIVKTIEFKPNKLILWPVVQTSFHSYREEAGGRKTIKMFIQKNMNPAQLQSNIAKTKEYADDWRK